MKAFLITGRVDYEGEDTSLIAAESPQDAIDYFKQNSRSTYDNINYTEIRQVIVTPSITSVCELQ